MSRHQGDRPQAEGKARQPYDEKVQGGTSQCQCVGHEHENAHVVRAIGQRGVPSNEPKTMRASISMFPVATPKLLKEITQSAAPKLNRCALASQLPGRPLHPAQLWRPREPTSQVMGLLRREDWQKPKPSRSHLATARLRATHSSGVPQPSTATQVGTLRKQRRPPCMAGGPPKSHRSPCKEDEPWQSSPHKALAGVQTGAGRLCPRAWCAKQPVRVLVTPKRLHVAKQGRH